MPVAAGGTCSVSRSPIATDCARVGWYRSSITVQLAHLPTQNEVWRAAMPGGAVADVTLIEAFARACPYNQADRMQLGNHNPPRPTNK